MKEFVEQNVVVFYFVFLIWRQLIFASHLSR